MTHQPVQWVTFGDGSTPATVFLWHAHTSADGIETTSDGSSTGV